MFDRFSIDADLIMTAPKDLTEDERLEAVLLVEQHLNSLSPVILKRLETEVTLRVHMKGVLTTIL